MSNGNSKRSCGRRKVMITVISLCIIVFMSVGVYFYQNEIISYYKIGVEGTVLTPIEAVESVNNVPNNNVSSSGITEGSGSLGKVYHKKRSKKTKKSGKYKILIICGAILLVVLLFFLYSRGGTKDKSIEREEEEEDHSRITVTEETYRILENDSKPITERYEALEKMNNILTKIEAETARETSLQSNLDKVRKRLEDIKLRPHKDTKERGKYLDSLYKDKHDMFLRNARSQLLDGMFMVVLHCLMNNMDSEKREMLAGLPTVSEVFSSDGVHVDNNYDHVGKTFIISDYVLGLYNYDSFHPNMGNISPVYLLIMLARSLEVSHINESVNAFVGNNGDLICRNNPSLETNPALSDFLKIGILKPEESNTCQSFMNSGISALRISELFLQVNSLINDGNLLKVILENRRNTKNMLIWMHLLLFRIIHIVSDMFSSDYLMRVSNIANVIKGKLESSSGGGEAFSNILCRLIISLHIFITGLDDQEINREFPPFRITYDAASKKFILDDVNESLRLLSNDKSLANGNQFLKLLSFLDNQENGILDEIHSEVVFAIRKAFISCITNDAPIIFKHLRIQGSIPIFCVNDRNELLDKYKEYVYDGLRDICDAFVKIVTDDDLKQVMSEKSFIRKVVVTTKEKTSTLWGGITNFFSNMMIFRRNVPLTVGLTPPTVPIQDGKRIHLHLIEGKTLEPPKVYYEGEYDDSFITELVNKFVMLRSFGKLASIDLYDDSRIAKNMSRFYENLGEMLIDILFSIFARDEDRKSKVIKVFSDILKLDDSIIQYITYVSSQWTPIVGNSFIDIVPKIQNSLKEQINFIDTGIPFIGRKLEFVRSIVIKGPIEEPKLSNGFVFGHNGCRETREIFQKRMCMLMGLYEDFFRLNETIRLRKCDFTRLEGRNDFTSPTFERDLKNMMSYVFPNIILEMARIICALQYDIMKGSRLEVFGMSKDMKFIGDVGVDFKTRKIDAYRNTITYMVKDCLSQRKETDEFLVKLNEVKKGEKDELNELKTLLDEATGLFYIKQ